MIKGTQRQMVMVRTDDSERFEMAYFLLRTDGEGREERSMIDEANRIVSSVCGNGKGSKREKIRGAFLRILIFSVGAAFGAAALGVILVLVFAL